MIFFDLLATVLLFAVFSASHTWLASYKLKESIASKIGAKIAFYRLFYNVSSILFFGAFYALAPKPDVIVYDLRFPFDIITFALQVCSLAGLIWAAGPIGFKEFAGIAQIERYMKGEYRAEELDEKQVLKIEGAFKLVRHPIYLFSILFLGFRPTMDLFYMTMFVCIVIYFYAGSFYEEKKLIRFFGDDYREYQKRVPRIFPVKF
jgi:protein-S-isoprenylcysteine O-methyltransferase Ste14